MLPYGLKKGVDHAWNRLLDVVGTERGHEVFFVQVRFRPPGRARAALRLPDDGIRARKCCDLADAVRLVRQRCGHDRPRVLAEASLEPVDRPARRNLLRLGGIVYFGVIDSSMGVLDGVINLAWLWAAIFILAAILFLVAGIVRRDLVIAPRWDLSSVLGALFMCYALVAYPIIEMLGGQPLRESPLFGLAPCVTVFFAFACCCGHGPRRPLSQTLLYKRH